LVAQLIAAGGCWHVAIMLFNQALSLTKVLPAGIFTGSVRFPKINKV
jgi:hypothetical protein